MKSLLTILLLSCLCISARANDGLPQKANTFITTHFPNTEVLRVKEEKGSIFEVMLGSGHELEFDKNGDWIEVDGDYLPLPKSVIDLLPLETQQYLAKKHSRTAIVKIEKELRNYEVGLSNSEELLFDQNGKFIKYD